MLLRLIFTTFPALYKGGLWFRNHLSLFGITVFYCSLLAGIIGLDAKSNLSSMIFSLGFSTILLSTLFCFFFRPKVKAKRQLPEFVTVDDEFTYTIMLDNTSSSALDGLWVCDIFEQPFPSYEEFKNAFSPSNLSSNSFDKTVGYYKWVWVLRYLRGGDSIRTEVSSLRGDNILKLKLTPVRRGIITMTEIKLFRPDPFGLCFATSSISCTDSILVLPKRYEVPNISLPGASPLHQPGGVPFSSSVGESDDFSSLREYRSGDSFRGIHWKSWAKTGKPIVKETHPEFFIRNALVLDTLVSTEQHESFEEAVSVATSFICTIDTQESLLDLIFVGDKPYNFTTGRGLSSPASMLKILACAQTAPDKEFESLACSVIKNSSQFSGCILILCSFDDQRKALYNKLLHAKIKLITLIVSNSKIENLPPDVIQLTPGNIQEGLNNL